MQRIIALDLKSEIPAKELNDLYHFLNEIKAVRFNDLSFFVSTKLTEKELMDKISKVMSRGDKAHILKSDPKDGFICETFEFGPEEKEIN